MNIIICSIALLRRDHEITIFTLIQALFFILIVFTSVAYIQEHFRLDFFMKKDVDQTTDLGPYINYRLPWNISRRAKQTTNIVTDGLNVDYSS